MNSDLDRATLAAWLSRVNRLQHWCILISADPDAMGSASALRRILLTRTRSIDICRINQVTRPDNLAMIRYLRLNIKEWSKDKAEQYTHFALVDSQPHHNKAFEGIAFSIVIDHHPAPRPEQTPSPLPPFYDIRPSSGSTSTVMTSYLRLLGIRPTPRLATALIYGIRTDTAMFERSGGSADLVAYQWLSRKADTQLLRRITRSEYLREWLPLFAKAFRNLEDCRGNGAHAWIGDVTSADLLVAIADFFTRVHGLKWIAVSGIVRKTVVVIFRGDGSRDIGRLADACFHDIGSAGGHRNLGRAEFPLESVPQVKNCREFIQVRLQTRKLRSLSATGASGDATSSPKKLLTSSPA